MSHRHLPSKVAEVRDATIWATLVRVISWEADIDAAQEVIVHPKRPVQGEKADSPLRRTEDRCASKALRRQRVASRSFCRTCSRRGRDRTEIRKSDELPQPKGLIPKREIPWRPVKGAHHIGR